MDLKNENKRKPIIGTKQKKQKKPAGMFARVLLVVAAIVAGAAVGVIVEFRLGIANKSLRYAGVYDTMEINLDEYIVYSWLHDVRSTKNDWDNQRKSINGKLLIEENSLKNLVNVRKEDPDSDTCLRVKTRIENLKKQVRQLDVFISDLAPMESGLVRVVDEIRTNGEVKRRPEIIALKKSVEFFLTCKNAEDPFSIPAEDWEKELKRIRSPQGHDSKAVAAEGAKSIPGPMPAMDEKASVPR